MRRVVIAAEDVAFRPVLELQLLLKRMDVDGFAGYLAQHEFRPEPDEPAHGAQKVVSDGRTAIFLYADVLGAGRRAEVQGIFDRSHPMKMYGPSLFRPDLEDAVLLVCLEHARAGYQVPWLSFVDLRELMTGAKSMGGVEWRCRPCTDAQCGECFSRSTKAAPNRSSTFVNG